MRPRMSNQRQPPSPADLSRTEMRTSSTLLHVIIDDAVKIVLRMEQLAHVAVWHSAAHDLASEKAVKRFRPAQFTFREVPVEQRRTAVAEEQFGAVA